MKKIKIETKKRSEIFRTLLFNLVLRLRSVELLVPIAIVMEFIFWNLEFKIWNFP